MYCLPQNVCVVPVSQCASKCSLHMFCLCFLYVGSYFLILEFESWITGVCSPYVVALGNFTYYVVE